MVERDTIRALEKLKIHIGSRLRGMVTRARVAASKVTLQGQSVTLDLLEGEQRDSVEYFENYGMSGAVPTGSTCLAFAAGGSRDQIIALGASPKGSIPEGKLPGEVDYWSIHGQRIRHHITGDTSIQAAPAGEGDAGVVYLGSDVNPLLPFVNGHGDVCIPTTAMITFMAQVVAALSNPAIVALGNTTPPYAPPLSTANAPISTTVAAATKTRVS